MEVETKDAQADWLRLIVKTTSLFGIVHRAWYIKFKGLDALIAWIMIYELNFLMAV